MSRPYDWGRGFFISAGSGGEDFMDHGKFFVIKTL
jgi:hypothetical protein